MSHPLQVIQKWLTLLLSATGLFLSAWIVVPAPTMPLLILGVGAPEVSPWLLVLNVISLTVCFATSAPYWSTPRFANANAKTRLLSLWGRPYSRALRLALYSSLIACLLSSLPLLQIPATQERFIGAMYKALGADYLAKIPKEVQLKMRSHPFSLADSFRGIAASKARYTADIRFATRNGVPLSMDIYRPIQVGQYPAIVVIYGGAWQRGNPRLNADFSRYMAARGYTVFAIDYRHAPRYPFPAQLDDVRAALAFIRLHAADYEADPARIALLGRSAGAHLAMLAAYEPNAPPVRAVISYYGPVDLVKGYAEPPRPNPINTRAVLKAFLGGSPTEVPQLYRLASPISYVTTQMPPTLLVYASRDHIVEVRFGQKMYERLRTVGSTVVFLKIPWAEHAFDAVFQGPSNQLALYYTERFLAWALRD